MTSQFSKIDVCAGRTLARGAGPILAPNPRTLAALLKLEVEEMFNAWEASKPLRTGAPHASAILASESDFCLRRLVLLAVFPDQAQHPGVKPWDAFQNARFLHGWHIHEKYQALFLKFGRVVYFNNDLDKPELDYTHFDEDRFVFFSPDAILEYASHQIVVEIKGYKQETFEKLDEQGDPPKAAWDQCNVYCHILGLKYGLILVENKNTQEMKTWVIKHNAEQARPYTDRLYDVKGAVTVARNTGNLPARKCGTPGDRQAAKCSVCKLCFSK